MIKEAQAVEICLNGLRHVYERITGHASLVPYDMELQHEKTKEYMDDLTQWDQCMMDYG